MTAYPYAAGADPAYDAWQAQYKYGQSDAENQASLKRNQDSEDYRNTLTSIGKQQETGTKNIDTSLLARGMYASGERQVKQNEFSGQITTAKTAADVAYQRQVGQVGSDLQRALAALDLQNEQQIGAAVGRKGAKDAADAQQAESDRQFAAEQSRQQQQLDYQTQQQQQAESAAQAQAQAQADQQAQYAASQAAWQQQRAADDARYKALIASSGQVTPPPAAHPAPAPIKVMPRINVVQPPRGSRTRYS